MKKKSTVIVIVFLLALSAVIYLIQITQFRSPKDTFFYLLQDLAFLPVQIALVTVALGKIISAREKRERLRKTKMMVNAFFSEIGTDLMRRLVSCGNIVDEINSILCIEDEWSSKDFRVAADSISKCTLDVDCKIKDLMDIKEILIEKRTFILIMLANPTLLEHEAFTDMLWAIFHLTDELLARDSFGDLPQTDIMHLNKDVTRATSAVLIHWIGYMRHIKADYPYLFSLELRRNPLNKNADIIIR